MLYCRVPDAGEDFTEARHVTRANRADGHAAIFVARPTRAPTLIRFQGAPSMWPPAVPPATHRHLTVDPETSIQRSFQQPHIQNPNDLLKKINSLLNQQVKTIHFHPGFSVPGVPVAM